MFKITQGKGFQITFKNGITVSVQFGPGNYGENYHSSMMDWIKPKMPFDMNLESNTAEVALFDTNGWVTKEACKACKIDCDDDVVGYVNAEKVAKLIEWAVNQK